MNISETILERLLVFQKNEITEHHIYRKLSRKVESPANRKVLEDIAADELSHYRKWREYTGRDIEPNRLKVWIYYFISRIFGFTFGLKLLEKGEKIAQDSYGHLRDAIPEADEIAHNESEHEAALLSLLDEEKLKYTGSMVLGLNDALMELTGVLAGLTLALRDTKLIALAGSITGIAAAMSMGASEYLATKTEETGKNPLRASLYTIGAYAATIVVLILPYLILENYYLCLMCSLAGAALIIAAFTYYISVAKDLPFKRHFMEMAVLSFAVAAISFLIGYAMRLFFGIDV
ncbi:MAG TPA: VIT1/CCC1 transporter family protein [Syntrophales bacterium]|nr:VIT1/CCC1 transporter family protein [Syntrophales bacterium]